MSRQYSIPTMLRMVPNYMLQQFFERLGCADTEFPWDRLREREVAPMLKWMGLLPRQLQSAIDSQFRQVFDLAQHSGMETLLEAAATCGDPSLAADMPSNVGLYAKAMWAWLHRRDVCNLATRIHQVEHITWWRKR